MKLLDKSEIAKAKNTERAKEVAEGLKISRRVDSLRELKSKEEETLEKFRNESLVAIHKEISELEKTRNGLRGEVGSLQSKLDSLLPGMETERRALNEQRLRIEAEEKELKNREEELNLKEIDIAIALKNADNDAKREKSHKELAEKLHGDAQTEKEESARILQRAKGIEEKAVNIKRETEEALSLRGEEMAIREKSLTSREQTLSDKERELVTKEIQVADQRKTLERALQRLRDNRLA